MAVYLIGTLDTKGGEIAFVRDQLIALGVETCVIDTGCLHDPTITADIPREKIFEAAGTTLQAVQERGDRGEAVTFAADGLTKLIVELIAAGKVDGLLGLGGSAGTTIATSAMRALPLGVPKMMVSTLASGQTRPYVGGKDIFMLNSVVDISGLNRISRTVLGEAAKAMAGLIRLKSDVDDDQSIQNNRPLVAATMFGVTTPCVQHAQRILEEAGCEVLVFHATGNGGEAMEGLIADGLVSGVLDITTTELADELVGGILSAGPARMTAAGKKGVPQIISVGAIDMVNFGHDTPREFAERKFYVHNPTVTLMRTTVEENRLLGKEIGEKAAAAIGPTAILLPLKGVSDIDQAGQPFDDPEARQVLFQAIRENCGDTELVEIDAHINDALFADAAARRLLEMIHK